MNHSVTMSTATAVTKLDRAAAGKRAGNRAVRCWPAGPTTALAQVEAARRYASASLGKALLHLTLPFAIQAAGTVKVPAWREIIAYPESTLPSLLTCLPIGRVDHSGTGDGASGGDGRKGGGEEVAQANGCIGRQGCCHGEKQWLCTQPHVIMEQSGRRVAAPALLSAVPAARDWIHDPGNAPLAAQQRHRRCTRPAAPCLSQDEASSTSKQRIHTHPAAPCSSRVCTRAPEPACGPCRHHRQTQTGSEHTLRIGGELLTGGTVRCYATHCCWA